MLKVKLLTKSINERGTTLLSFLLTYPKPIHPHILTHREFSRCSSSGRATPSKVAISVVEDLNMLPVFCKEKGGMSGSVLTIEEASELNKIWLEAKADAIAHAKRLAEAGAHKTFINDLLAPFAQITTIITANDFSHFYHQRCDIEHVRLETYRLAEAMKQLDQATEPTLLKEGEWHTLFSKDVDEDVAICARVSRNKADKSAFTYEENIDLFKRLASTVPFHGSAFEHTCENRNDGIRYGNKLDYKSMRQFFSHEYTGKYK